VKAGWICDIVLCVKGFGWAMLDALWCMCNMEACNIKSLLWHLILKYCLW